jgi:hypothetical protein
MKRIDRIKLSFTRNWNFLGKERLSHWFKASEQVKSDLSDGITRNADNYIEWTLLKGLKHTIAKHKPGIIFEDDHYYRAATGQDNGDCYDFLTGLGYTLFQIQAPGCELIRTPGQFPDRNLFGIAAGKQQEKPVS